MGMIYCSICLQKFQRGRVMATYRSSCLKNKPVQKNLKFLQFPPIVTNWHQLAANCGNWWLSKKFYFFFLQFFYFCSTLFFFCFKVIWKIKKWKVFFYNFFILLCKEPLVIILSCSLNFEENLINYFAFCMILKIQII